MKLDDRESLMDTVHSDGWKVALQLLHDLVESVEVDVLRHDLSNPNVTELVIKKARAEGAARLVDSFKREINKLKPKND